MSQPYNYMSDRKKRKISYVNRKPKIFKASSESSTTSITYTIFSENILLYVYNKFCLTKI